MLTKAPVEQRRQPCDDDDDRSLLENCCIKDAKPPWVLGHPPPTTARAVRVHVLCTLLLCALTTADRLPDEREVTGGEPMGWQGWRRQLLEQNRDTVIGLAPGDDSLLSVAESSLLLGAKLKDGPPGIGPRQKVLARYTLTAHG